MNESSLAKFKLEAMGCAASGWQAERHVYYGAEATVRKKIADARHGERRRLYFVVVEAGDAATVFEYEHQDNGEYAVRATDVSREEADRFNAEAEAAMFETQGRSCVGEAIQATSVYRNLSFKENGRASLSGAQSLADHQLFRPASDRFYKVSTIAPC